MAASLMLTIMASVLTTVTDWAGWHFVWRHENTTEETGPNKHSATSIFLSYYLPFMPVLAIILGPSKLDVYNNGFVHVSTIVLFTVLAIVTGGVAASAWAFSNRLQEQKESRIPIEQEINLPEHAAEHLIWTTVMLVSCSIFWSYLLIF
jgi:hypothetical protein